MTSETLAVFGRVAFDLQDAWIGNLCHLFGKFKLIFFHASPGSLIAESL